MIKRATNEEFELVVKLLQSGQRLMRKAGNQVQWQDLRRIIELARRDLDKGDCYLLWENQEALATFCLPIGRESNYDVVEGGKWQEQGEYGALHRIASSGRKKGVGKEIFNWAKLQCPSLRIDTHEKNLPMIKVIEDNGFHYVGIIYVEDGSPRKAYEWNKKDAFALEEGNQER